MKKHKMRTPRQIFLGLITALASSGIILGAFSLSFVEGSSSLPVHVSPTISSPMWVTSTISSDLTIFITPAVTMILITPTRTLTMPPTMVNCPPKPGWAPYQILPGDTLDILALRHNMTSEAIMDANCLLTTALLPGNLLYLPPLPTLPPASTATSVLCGLPNGWVVYMVRQGDTLYRLSQAYGTTVLEIQNANCMGRSTLIHVGHIIYVPWWATHTPTPTLIYPPMNTPSGTLSGIPAEPSLSYTPLPTDTPTPSAIPPTSNP